MKCFVLLFLLISSILNFSTAQIAGEVPAATADAPSVPVDSALQPAPVIETAADPIKEAVIQKIIKELTKLPTPKGHDFMTLYRSLPVEAKTPNVIGPSCVGFLDALRDVATINNKRLDYQWIRQYGNEALKASFNARRALHQAMKHMSMDCRLILREVFREMRMAEDMIGSIYYRTKPLSEEEIAKIDKYIPVIDQKNLNPPLTPFGFPHGQFKYRSGDIFMVKGKTIPGSVVSEISIPRSVFSHLGLVHVDEKTRQVSVIQNFGNVSVKIYPLKEFLAYDNFRLVLLRPDDAEAGKKAADYAFRKVKESQARNIDIPYDFHAHYNDEKEQDCIEVIYHAYKSGTGGKFIIPEVKSSINFSNLNMMERFMIKNGERMVPGDLESDTRFNIEWEWTNYKLVRESWMKDALVSEVFRWTNELRYKLKDNFHSYRNRFLWTLRFVPGVWDIIVHFAPYFGDLHKNMPTEIVGTSVLFYRIEKYFIKPVQMFDKQYYETNDRWLSFEELKNVIEKLRMNRKQLIETFFELPAK